MQSLLLTLSLFFSLTTFAKRSEKTWTINKDHSEILFQVPYMGVSNVTGRFNSFSGGLEYFEAGDPLPKKIWIYIDPSSIDSGSHIRDGHLKGRDFFNTEKYPMITFKAIDVKPIAPGKYQAAGLLKIKDQEKPFKIKYSISEESIDTWKKKSRFVSFSFPLNRKDFGLDWNKAVAGAKFLVGEEIQVTGQFQIQVRGKKTAGSKHMIPITKRTKLKDDLFTGKITLKDFNKKIEEEALTPVMMPKKAKITLTPNDPALCGPRTPLRDNEWYLWFCTLAALGFAGATVTPLVIKKFFRDNYEGFSETNMLGLLTDIPILLVIFMYAYAVWFVAYGKM